MRIFLIQENFCSREFFSLLKDYGVPKGNLDTNKDGYIYVRTGIEPKEIIRRIKLADSRKMKVVFIIPHYLNQSKELYAALKDDGHNWENHLSIVGNHLEEADYVDFVRDDDLTDLVKIIQRVKTEWGRVTHPAHSSIFGSVN